MTREQLAEALVQIGRDEMAAVLADLLDSIIDDEAADGYRDGVEDALLTLVHAGAADPR